MAIDLTYAFREVLDRHRIRYSEKGSRLELCCPFHDDRTPSSGVYKSTGKFYCFSCDLTLNAAQFKARLDGEGEVKAIIKLEEKYGLLEKVQDKERKFRVLKEKVKADKRLSDLRGSGLSRVAFGKAADTVDRLFWLYEGEVISTEQFDTFLEMWYNEGWEEFYVESPDAAIDEARRFGSPQGLSVSSGATGVSSTSGIPEGTADLSGHGAQGVRRALEAELLAPSDGVRSESDAGDDIVDLA